MYMYVSANDEIFSLLIVICTIIATVVYIKYMKNQLKENIEPTIYGKMFRYLTYVSLLILLSPFLSSVYNAFFKKGVRTEFGLIKAHFFDTGISIAFKAIPIYIVVAMLKKFLLTKNNEQIARNVYRSKMQSLNGVNKSMEVLNSLDLSENLQMLIPKHKNTPNKINPEIVKLPSTDHYNFTQNQLSEITSSMKEMISKSNNSYSEPYRNIIRDNEATIDDIISVLLKELSAPIQIPERINYLNNSENYYTFFKPLYDFCHTNNIEVDLKKSISNNIVSQYEAIFKNMIADLNKQLGISKKGFLGEQKVSEHLELYRDVIVNLENILFGVEDTTVEADNIVICDKGVFCIETKNYGNSGQTIQVTKDGRWRRFQGRNELEMRNVSEQHNRHVGIMQRTVNQELKKRGFEHEYIFFEPIYVIANDEVEIINECNEISLLRASNIYPYISKFQCNNPLSKEIQEVIKDIILSHKQNLINYPVLDYRNSFKSEFEKLLADIENKGTAIKAYEKYIELIETQYTVDTEMIENERYITLK